MKEVLFKCLINIRKVTLLLRIFVYNDIDDKHYKFYETLTSCANTYTGCTDTLVELLWSVLIVLGSCMIVSLTVIHGIGDQKKN
jgi:hypothetical protein